MPALGDFPVPKAISLFFSGRTNYVHAAPRVEHPDDPVPASEKPQTFDVIGSEDTDPDFINLQVSPEAWRFVAYLFFWTMCGIAILLNNTLVAPILLKGNPDGSSCPPFESGGKGFDVHTNSHLNRLFGFNNVRAFPAVSSLQQYSDPPTEEELTNLLLSDDDSVLRYV